MFVEEMGTHTSLAPLYAYGRPVGERVFFEIPRGTAPRTRRFLGAFIEEGWDLPSMAVEGATTTARVFETYIVERRC